MTDQQKQPLWRMLDEAYDNALQISIDTKKFIKWGPTRAIEISALIKWLDLEQPKPDPNEIQPGGTLMYYQQKLAVWEYKQELLQLLNQEVVKANNEE